MTPDEMIERKKIRQRLRKWQIIAIIAIILALLVFVKSANVGRTEVGGIRSDYIARVSIEGIILDDLYREKVLKELAEDKHAKALILHIDSPGGTTVGGEAIYGQVRKISESGKPVVVVMRTVAASGGYMAAIGGDYILARHGTITGSIGVIAQTAEFTELAQKIGIKLENFKSAELKATPSPFEKTSPKAAEALQYVIDDFYNYFVSLVALRRSLDMPKAKELADGRVYTGAQAAANGLIDAIGGEEEAKEWLAKEKKINKNLKIEDIEVIEPETTLLEHILGNPESNQIYQRLNLSGLLAIWHP